MARVKAEAEKRFVQEAGFEPPDGGAWGVWKRGTNFKGVI